MGLQEIMSLIQTASVILAILVAVGTLRNRGDDKTTALVTMQMDIKYIKERIDGVDSLRDRITACESCAKSAHNRLDEHLKYAHKDAGRNTNG